MKKKKRGVQRSHDHCNGEGMGEEVANSHMTVGGGGGGGGPARARLACHSGPVGPLL